MLAGSQNSVLHPKENPMTRRTIQSALTLIAVAGLAGPAVAQDATRDAPTRERVRQPREGAAAQDGATREQAMERRREALNNAVESGRMTQEQADAMLERMSQASGGEAQAGRDRAGADALPGQINKMFDLDGDQTAKVNQLIRDLRQTQMATLREMRGGGADAAGRGAPAEGERPQRGAGGEDRPQRGADNAEGGAGGRGARGERGAPGEGERPQRGGAGGDDDAGGGEGALRGPRVGREDGAAGRGGPDAMGEGGGARGGAGGFGQMSEEERRAFVKDVVVKLAPVNRQFAKDLAAVLDEDQRKELRANWGELSVMPVMIERMVEAEKAAKKAKDDTAKDDTAKKGKGEKKKGKAAGDDDAKDAAEKPAASGKKPTARQEGRRGGRSGGDDD